jgi:predicted nucleic-acid-binding Zn-ribbon protein
MLEGICPKCGNRHVGWALQFERYQACTKCGTGLDIYEGGKLVAKGYSPFTAEKYTIDIKPNVPSEEGTSDSQS